MCSALKKSGKEVRKEICQIFAELLENYPNYQLRNELIELIKSLACSKSCNERLIFLEICETFHQHFSKSFFKTHFIPSYLDLASDKSPNVAYKYCTIASLMRTKTPHAEKKTGDAIENSLKEIIKK